MASVLTAGEIATYRKKGQWKKYYLAIAKYNTIFSAELDAVPTSNDMVTQITYVNGAYASGYSVLTDIRVDMTLYVGTSPGAYDLGMARIRKTPTSSILYLGEVSEIDWGHNECLEDTIYLTVVDDYQLRAKPIKLLNDVAYMDVDVAIGTNHTTFDPVPIMGGHRIAVLDETTGLAGVVLGPDANTAAWVLNSTIASVLWEIPGASFVDDLTEINPVAVFDTPGIYPAYCTFTSTTGKTAWGVRYVIVFDHSANRPIIDFAHQNKNVTYDAGGWSFEAVINSGANQTEIRDHSLCILFSENYIDGALVQRPETFPADQSVETTGYIGRYSITRNWEKGSATFTVEGAQGWLKKMQGFPSGLEFKTGTAAAWTDMPLLTVTRMIWHFLHWRTTATKVMDVILPPDTLYATAFNSMQKFLWDQIVEIANPAIFASPGVDCYGRFFLEVEPQMVPLADRTWPTVMTFTSQDWHGDLIWDVETESQIGILVSAGLHVNASKAVKTFFSMSPGHIPKQYGGDITVLSNVPLVASQAQSNSNCGLYAGWKNNPYKRFELSLRANFKAVDLWPRQKFGLVVSPTEDPRGIGYNGNVIPREISYEDDRGTGYEYPIINFEAESFAQLAINGDIPINPTDSIDFPSIPDDLDFGDFILDPPIVLPLPNIIGDISHALVHDTNHGLLYTDTFNVVPIAWVSVYSMDEEDAKNIHCMIVTSNRTVFVALNSGIWYADSPTATYSQIISQQDIWDAFPEFAVLWAGAGYFYTDIHIKSIGYNPNTPEDFVAIISVDDQTESVFTFNSSGITGTSYPAQVIDANSPVGKPDKLSYGAGGWVFTHATGAGGLGQYISRYDAGATYIDTTQSGLGSAGLLTQHYRLGTSELFYMWESVVGNYSLALCDSSTTPPTINASIDLPFSPATLAADITGTYIMATDGANLYRSSDGGMTWGYDCLSCLEGEALILPSDFPAIISRIHCIDADRWIVIGKTTNNAITGNVIIYTDDFGSTWQSKIGNLLELYPDSASGNLAFDLIQAWP